MATGQPNAETTAERTGGVLGDWSRQGSAERLSLLPLAGAVGTIAVGGRLAWPVAASLLAVAYLALYLGTR